MSFSNSGNLDLMKSIFSHDLSLRFRFIIAVLIALGVIISDSKLEAFSQIKIYMDTAISPIYFISNSPRELLDRILKMFVFRNKLEIENRILHKELLLKSSQLLMLEHYKQENSRLRRLLNSPLHQQERIMITQVISVVNNPYSDQVIIDKGSINGVYEGQAVIDDKGIVGQVVGVAKLTSRVLLISDTTHAIPTQVLRNDIRVIACGIGCFDSLELRHLPPNIDIQLGDLLITSGLDGRFPEGYPVAIVSCIEKDIHHAYTIIRARPTANLDHLHYLLLLWNSDNKEDNPISPEEIRVIAKERLLKRNSQVLPLY